MRSCRNIGPELTPPAATLRGHCWTHSRGGSRVANMRPTIEAEVDENGNIRMKEQVSLPPGAQLLIYVLGGTDASETTVLSEASLAADWDRPEEDAAWAALKAE